MRDGKLYLVEGQIAVVEPEELFGPVLVGNDERVVEEDYSLEGFGWRNGVDDAAVDQGSVDNPFSLDDHDVNARVLCAESEGEVKIPDTLVLEGDVLAEAALEHHRAVVDVLHPALLGQVQQLPEADAPLVQNCVDGLLVRLVRVEDQALGDPGVVDLEHFLDVLGLGVLVQLAAVCVLGLAVEEVCAQVGEYLLELR